MAFHVLILHRLHGVYPVHSGNRADIALTEAKGGQHPPVSYTHLDVYKRQDIDIGFDDSTLQPTLELLLRGATVDSARKFAPAVRKAVDLSLIHI